MKQTVAVIIPTLGRMFWVIQLVGSLLHGKRKPDEILVVDQTPHAERSPIAYREIERLEKTAPVTRIPLDQPGLAAARNKGAAYSEAEILIFLDDDVFVTENFLEEYRRVFSSADVGAATGMILVHPRDDGTFKPLITRQSLPHEATMLRGGNLAVRRDVLFSVGGFDERFVRASNHEDWDFAWRVYEKGFKAIWTPGPWCYHAAVSHGGGRWWSFDQIADACYNISYFHLRHPQVLGGAERLAGRLLRQFIFNKRNLSGPWRLSASIPVVVRAVLRARAAAREGPILPLTESPWPHAVDRRQLGAGAHARVGERGGHDS